MNELGLDELLLDALREAINIAAANSATSLSELVGTRVNIDIPSVKGMFGNGCEKQLKTDNTFYVSLLDDGKSGFLVVSYTQKGLGIIHDIITKRFGVETELEDILVESSNILMGSFLSGLHDFSGLKLSMLPPAHLSREEVLEMCRGKKSFTVICEAVLMPEVDGNISTRIIFVPSGNALEELMNRLKDMLA